MRWSREWVIPLKCEESRELCNALVGNCICRRSKPRPEHGSNTQAWGFGLVTTHMLNSFVFNYGYIRDEKKNKTAEERIKKDSRETQNNFRVTWLVIFVPGTLKNIQFITREKRSFQVIQLEDILSLQCIKRKWLLFRKDTVRKSKP